MGDEIEEFTERLAAAERSVRRLWAALAVAGLVAGMGLAGPWRVGAEKPPEVVIARGLKVVDGKGNVRADLAADAIGTHLRFYDEAGTLRTSLSAALDGTNLALGDEAGTERAILAATRGGAGFGLYDKAGKRLAVLAAGGTGTRLGLYDEAGKPRATLAAVPLKGQATGATGHRSEASLKLLNEKGRVLWKAP